MEIDSNEHKEFINDLKVSIITGMVTNITLQMELTKDVDTIANIVLDDVKKLIEEKNLLLTEKMKKLLYKSIIIGIGIKEELEDFDKNVCKE